MKKNTIFGSIIIIILFFSAIAYGVYINQSSRIHVAQQTRHAESVVVEPSIRRDFEPVLRVSSRWEPAWADDVYATTDGKIERLLFKDGEAVSSGTVIAVIEGRELAAQLKQAQGNVIAAKAGYDQAVSELRRAELLSAQNAIAERMVEAARFRLEQANGQLISAQGALEQTTYKADGLRISVTRSGVIGKFYVSPGQFIRTGTAVASLSDYTTLKAMLPVANANKAVWQSGDRVVVNLPDGQCIGTITRRVDSQTIGAGHFLLEVSIDNSRKILQPGMQPDVEVRKPVVKNALMIPEQAIVTREGKPAVYCIDAENRVKIQSVTLGYCGDGWCVIDSGLIEGEKVVVQGQAGLSAGMILPSVKGAGQP